MKQYHIYATLFLLFTHALIFPHKAIAQSLPPNSDFSSGNFTNWSCYTGTAIPGSPSTGAVFSAGVLSGPVAGRHTITSGTGVDAISGYPLVAPGGGTYSSKIGNSSVGAEADRIRYQIHVPAGTTKFSLQTQFSVVFENPAHGPAEQPAFQVVAYDSATGAVIPSANNLYIAGYSVPGFVTLPSTVQVLPWTASTVNLGGKGGRTVTLEVSAMDCAPGGHFGYAYFDLTGFTSYLAPLALQCGRDSIRLQAPAGYKYYQWFDQSYSTALNGAADTSRTQLLPLPATAQYYNLILIPYNSAGIPDTIRTNLLNPPFSISASGSAACATPGLPIQLTTTVTGASSGLHYTWTGSTASLNSTLVANPIARPTGPSWYAVTVSDTNGCFRSDTVSLMNGAYVVNAGPDRTACKGATINLNANVSPASPAYTYSWLPAANLSGNTIVNPVYTASMTGMQRLVLRVDSGACSVYDTLLVRVLPDTFGTIAVTTCKGRPTQLGIHGDTAFTYHWTPSQKLSFGTAADSMHPVFNADTTTMFTVRASYPGCPDITRQLTAVVEPVPVVDLGADTIFTGASGPATVTAQVTPAGFNPYSYAWQPASQLDSPSRPTVRYSGSQDTTLIVMVRTPAGCYGLDSVHVINIQNIVQMPNAFVPGSINSSFRMAAIAPGYSFRAMHIYDRWGRLVYETTKPDAGWDGNNGGTRAPMGVYVYLLEASAQDGHLIRQQGNLTLIR
jgi:gliding motility-associated-like protein